MNVCQYFSNYFDISKVERYPTGVFNKMDNTAATQILIDYQQSLSQKVLELRAEACRLAAIARSISSTISEQDIKELKEHLELEQAYSLKGISNLLFNKS